MNSGYYLIMLLKYIQSMFIAKMLALLRLNQIISVVIFKHYRLHQNQTLAHGNNGLYTR